MSTTSSLLTHLNVIAGRLPKGAVTEWLDGAASADVVIQEDSCGNIVGDPIGIEVFHPDTPAVIKTRVVHPSHGAGLTNWQWAHKEVEWHNARYPNDPFVVRYSRLSDCYICICRKNVPHREETPNE